MTITDDSCGLFSGIGTNGTIAWTVSGEVAGNNVEMIIDYDCNNYYVNLYGTIAEDGTMSGDWTSSTDQFGTWTGTGTATPVDYKWNYFVKIVAAPEDANKIDGIWYNADGIEIGPDIWGQFAIVQEVYNDQCTGEHGIYDLSPIGPGFGKF